MLGQAWLFSVSVTYDHLRIHLKIQILILALGRGWKPENLIFLHIPSWCCWSEGYTLRGKDLCTIDLKGMILFKWPRDTARAKEQGVLAVLNWTPDIYMCHFSCVWLFATPWTVARQAPPSTGILQARILEWAARPSSRGSSWPRYRTRLSSTLPLLLPWQYTFCVLEPLSSS